MGDKQPSVRTLDDGDKVVHSPGGKQVLVPTNRLSAVLEGQQEELQADSEAKTDILVQRAIEKRASLDAGDPVPASKCVV